MVTNAESVVSEVTQRACQAIQDIFGIPASVQAGSETTVGFHATPDVAALILFNGIEGASLVAGGVFLSTDKKCACELCGIDADCSDDEFKEDVADALAECLNTAVGGALTAVFDHGAAYNFSPPHCVYGLIDLPAFAVLSRSIRSDVGLVGSHGYVQTGSMGQVLDGGAS